MCEIQRYRADLKTSENAVKRPKFKPDPEGSWVRFTDYERVVAEKDARNKALSETLDATLYERRAEARRVDAAHARIKSLSEANEHLTDRLNDTRTYWIKQVEPQVEERYAARIKELEGRLREAWGQIWGLEQEINGFGSIVDRERGDAHVLAVKAERERIKARTKQDLKAAERLADEHPENEFGVGFACGYRAALAAIDKEGEGE